MKTLTPKALASLAKAKPVHTFERGSGVGVYPLGERIVHVSHLTDRRPDETEPGFTVSTLSMKSELVVDGDLVVRNARVVVVLVRGTAIWIWYVQDDRRGSICRIDANSAGKLALVHTYAMPQHGQLVDAGDLVALKQGDALDLYTPGNTLEKVATIAPKWKRGTGLVSAVLHRQELAIVGTPHAGLQRYDITDPTKPKLLSIVAGRISGPGRLAAFDDYLLAFGYGVCDVYRHGSKESLGRLKLAGDTLLRVGDVLFFCTVSTMSMKHGRESSKIDVIQLGDKPKVLPAGQLPLMWIKGLATTASHLHVLGDIDDKSRVATFEL